MVLNIIPHRNELKFWKSKRISDDRFIKADDQTTHKSLNSILFVAQIFGLFPLQGILKPSIDSLTFSWISLRFLSSILTCFGGFCMMIGHLKQLIFARYEQFDMNGVMFHVFSVTSNILFIKIAKEWPKIMQKFYHVDKHMNASYGWPKTINKRIKIVSVILLSCEAVEHCSIQINKFLVAIECRHGSYSKALEHFSVNMSFTGIFSEIPYYPFLGVFFQIVNTRLAFTWTFLDVFIILISILLTQRFRQIHRRIRHLIYMKVNSEKSWIKVHQDYNKLKDLCEFTNIKICDLILVSFANNFYFIIFQVYESMTLNKGTVLEAVYFYTSMGVLFLRLILVCLFGSSVNEESKRPLKILYSVPNEIYNQEISRLSKTIKYENTSLSGKNLFNVKRSLILKFVGAVITYELVVIQFEARDDKEASKTSHNSRC